MTSFFKKFFTWWNGSTISTNFFTRRYGRFVGEDEFGNRYFEEKLTSCKAPRRWVIYKKYSEASFIPAGWHGWIHHRVDVPPSEESYMAHPWEKTHIPNLTLTKFAYMPKGSIKNLNQRPSVSADYEAWIPRE